MILFVGVVTLPKSLHIHLKSCRDCGKVYHTSARRGKVCDSCKLLAGNCFGHSKLNELGVKS